MRRRSVLDLTVDEAGAASRVLCWHTYGGDKRRACSLLKFHSPDLPCRRDLDVKPGPWTRRTWMCAGLGSSMGTALGVLTALGVERLLG